MINIVRAFFSNVFGSFSSYRHNGKIERMQSDAPQMSREAAVWAIRLFLGRNPTNEAEIDLHAKHTTFDSLRIAFAETAEFQNFFLSILGKPEYCAPLFLLAPPVDARIHWHFRDPTLINPSSQLCTESQISDDIFRNWCRALDLIPNAHRKTWEFCYVAAVIEACGLLRPGARALGFGVGREPIPALLASRGVTVVATDAPTEIIQGQGWDTTGQHAVNIESLQRPAILPRDQLEKMIQFRAVDMNNIPDDLQNFDICWSSCSLEHLGSIEHGIQFFQNSLKTLKPGGLAVHTTEFNLSSNDTTFESPSLCFFRRRDIENLLSRLVDDGHEVFPINFHPGSGALDTYVDLPPYALPHLKLEVAKFVATSIGLAVRKRS
jgi:hypothetical protein